MEASKRKGWKLMVTKKSGSTISALLGIGSEAIESIILLATVTRGSAWMSFRFVVRGLQAAKIIPE
jgi:hypothetical protein